jgi:pectate lyase
MPTFAESFIAKFYDNPTTATINGTVTGITFSSITIEKNLSKMSDWTFAITQAEYDDTLITTGVYCRLYSVVDGTEYREANGVLTKLDFQWKAPTQGPHMVQLRFKDDLWELAQTVISQGEIFELRTMTPIYAGVQCGWEGGGDSIVYPELTDDDAGTNKVFKLNNFTDSTLSSTDPSMFYVGNDAPFAEVAFDFDTAINEQNEVVTLNLQNYQVGANFAGWGSPASVTDDTDGGVTGRFWHEDGDIAWTKSQYEQQHNHDGYSLYWMRMYPTDGTINNVRMIGVTVEAEGPHSSDVSEVVDNWAPAAWSLHASSATATQKTFVVTAYGDSVLSVLDDLAERSGEAFTLSGTQEIFWLNSSNLPSSGVTAESGTSNEGDTDYCHITGMRRTNSHKTKVEKIYPRGGGGDDFAAVTLADLAVNPGTGNYWFSVPSGYTIGADDVNNISTYYIQNTNISDGITEFVEFPNISPIRGGTGRSRGSANELAKTAISYLQRNAADSEYYTATIVGLDDNTNGIFPGRTMVVQSTITAQDGTTTETINETLAIISQRKSFTKEGVKQFTIKFGSDCFPEPNTKRKAESKRIRGQIKNRHPQAASTAKVYGGSAPTVGIGSGTTPASGLAVHDIIGTRQSVTGAAGSLIGVPSTDTLGLMTLDTDYFTHAAGFISLVDAFDFLLNKLGAQAVIRSTVPQDITANTVTTISLETEVLDSDGFHSTNKIVIPSGFAGQYVIEGLVSMSNPDSAGPDRLGYLYVNERVVSVGNLSDVTNLATLIPLTAQYTLAEGDEITLRCWHNYEADDLTVSAYGQAAPRLALTYVGQRSITPPAPPTPDLRSYAVGYATYTASVPGGSALDAGYVSGSEITITNVANLKSVLENMTDNTVVKIEANGTYTGDITISGKRHWTIDATGYDVKIHGRLRIDGCNDFIIDNLEIYDPGVEAGGTDGCGNWSGNSESQNKDCLTLRNWPDAVNVFMLRRIKLSEASDGNLDFIWNNENDVYGDIIDCWIENGKKASLVTSNAGPEGGTWYLTFKGCYWENCDNRQPLIRDSYVHIYNSVYENYGEADGGGNGVEVSSSAELLFEYNYAKPREIGASHWCTADGTVTSALRKIARSNSGNVKSQNNLLDSNANSDTATVDNVNPGSVFTPPYSYTPTTMTTGYRDTVKAAAGPQY